MADAGHEDVDPSLSTAAGAERLARAREALQHAGADALLCVLPQDVLLLSGYWPVTGHSIALIHARGGSALVVPEDERSLAERAWVDEIRTFQRSPRGSSPHDLRPVLDAVRAALDALGGAQTICYEEGPSLVPVPYAALHVYGPSALDLVRAALPHATAVPAEALLAALRARPTVAEAERIRGACRLAADAFREGAAALRPGMAETEVANAFRARLTDLSRAHPSAERADAFVYCMSGPNAEHAYAAYQRSTRRRIGNAEPVLVHCNSFVDGYWTDVTRTYCCGEPPARLRAAFEAVLAARAAGLDAVRPGAAAEQVDAEVRRVLVEHGFGAQIKHASGHGVGFAAIDHDAPPRLRRGSEDTLEIGMVMNIEPGLYGPELGGVRHCDMVRVTADGCELLTPFQTELVQLVLLASGSGSERARKEEAP
jgi:Xaa-Pro aminopeptidase